MAAAGVPAVVPVRPSWNRPPPRPRPYRRAGRKAGRDGEAPRRGRKARAKTGMPVVSLVGYTNVGKSSLMNALCGPSVAEADMLFATLATPPAGSWFPYPHGFALRRVRTVPFSKAYPKFG